MIPLKVLFVEDDQVDQLAFQRFVEEHGLPITYLLAGSLSEAKCLVTQGEFDLIVADYSLGDGTALDLLPFAQGVPVILLTGVGDEEIAARAFTAGISDYLVKDIGRNYLEQLPERMEKAVGQRLRSGETLPESEEKFRQLFTRMPSAVAIYDAVDDGEDFIFKDFNTAAENIEGIKKDDLIGKRVTHVFLPA